MLRQLIDSQLNEINSVCAQNETSKKPSTVPYMKSLYLIHYHGFNRYELLKFRELCIFLIIFNGKKSFKASRKSSMQLMQIHDRIVCLKNIIFEKFTKACKLNRKNMSKKIDHTIFEMKFQIKNGC